MFIIDDLVSGGLNLIGSHQQNQANKGIMREQMAFQERMSNTSYQRAVADMQAAGINPMLAFQQGGASSPPGSSARMENVISPAVSSAMDMARTRAQLKTMDAQAYATEMRGFKDMSQGFAAQAESLDAFVTDPRRGGIEHAPGFEARGRWKRELLEAQIQAARGAASASSARAELDRAMRPAVGTKGQKWFPYLEPAIRAAAAASRMF